MVQWGGGGGRWVQTSLAVDEAAFLMYMGFRRRGFQGPYSGGTGIGGGRRILGGHKKLDIVLVTLLCKIFGGFFFCH